MWILWILIAGLTVANVTLTVCYYRTVDKKDRMIVRYILRNTRLEQLLLDSIRKDNMPDNRMKSALSEPEDELTVENRVTAHDARFRIPTMCDHHNDCKDE
jgi:hypothetical protein